MPGKRVFTAAHGLSAAPVVPYGGPITPPVPTPKEVALSKSTPAIARIVRKVRPSSAPTSISASTVVPGKSISESGIFAKVDPNEVRGKVGKKHLEDQHDKQDLSAREATYRLGKKVSPVVHQQPHAVSKRIAPTQAERQPSPYAADDAKQAALAVSGSVSLSVSNSPTKRTYKQKYVSTDMSSAISSAPASVPSHTNAPTPRNAMPRYHHSPQNNTSGSVSFRPVWADAPAGSPSRAAENFRSTLRVSMKHVGKPTLVDVWNPVAKPRVAYSVQAPFHTMTPRGAKPAAPQVSAAPSSSRAQAVAPAFVHVGSSTRPLSATATIKHTGKRYTPAPAQLMLQ